MNLLRRNTVFGRLSRLNALFLIVPLWFFYRMLTPALLDAWPEQRVGPFTAAPVPANMDPPYPHEDGHVKDFSVRFCDGCTQRMRLAYLFVGSEADAAHHSSDASLGVLHGTGPMLHAHVAYPVQPDVEHRLWLAVQEWNGRWHRVAWPLTQDVD